MSAMFRRTAARRPALAARLATTAVVAAVLAGCGGGGGGDDSGAPVVPSAATITASNYEGVARQTLVATTYLGDATGLVTGAQVAPGAQTLFAYARSQIGRLPGLFASRTPLVTGVTSTETFNCTGGGSISVQTTDNNGNNSVDVGDSATVTARSCVEEGATISGAITLSFSAVSGNLNTDTYSATVAVSLQELRASTQAGNATGSGQFTLAISSTSTSTNLDLSVPNLSVTGSFGGIQDTVTMADYRMTSTAGLSGGRQRVSTTVSGVVGSTVLAGGTVNLATVSPLVQFEGDLHPSGGQITATGAAGSRVRLTAQSPVTVLLELDADGNGAYETSLTKTWSSLV